MIQLDLKSRKSIYEQVTDGFKELISRHVLPQGTKLPSVRELSRTLTVNPNTIQKAYRQLEAENWIYIVSGLGCFVAERPAEVDMSKAKGVFDIVEECIKQLLYMGVSGKDIIEAVRAMTGEGSEQR